MDQKIELFKKFVHHLYGSLWWGRDDLIEEKQIAFVRRPDRIGHPLLSVRREEIAGRFDAIPMLVGTSGRHLNDNQRFHCVEAKGLDSALRNSSTYFGSTVEPGMYSVEDMLDGVTPKPGQIRPCRRKSDGKIDLYRKPWYETGRMAPNTIKPMLDEGELKDLDRFCAAHDL